MLAPRPPRAPSDYVRGLGFWPFSRPISRPAQTVREQQHTSPHPLSRAESPDRPGGQALARAQLAEPEGPRVPS